MVLRTSPVLIRRLPLPWGHKSIRLRFKLTAPEGAQQEAWLAAMFYVPDPNNDSGGRLPAGSGYGVLMGAMSDTDNIVIVDRPITYPGMVFDQSDIIFQENSIPMSFDGSGYHTFIARGSYDLSGTHLVEITVGDNHEIEVSIDGNTVLVGPSFRPVNSIEVSGIKPGYSINPDHFCWFGFSVVSDHSAPFEYDLQDIEILSIKDAYPGLIFDMVRKEQINQDSVFYLTIKASDEQEYSVKSLKLDSEGNIEDLVDIGSFTGSGRFEVPAYRSGEPMFYTPDDENYHFYFLVTAPKGTSGSPTTASISHIRFSPIRQGTRIGGKYSIWVKYFNPSVKTISALGGHIVLTESISNGSFVSVLRINTDNGWEPAIGKYSVEFTRPMRGSVYDTIDIQAAGTVTEMEILFNDIRNLQDGASEHSSIGEMPIVRSLFPVVIHINLYGGGSPPNVSEIVSEIQEMAFRKNHLVMREILNIVSSSADVSGESYMSYEYWGTNSEYVYETYTKEVNLPSSRYSFYVGTVNWNGERVWP